MFDFIASSNRPKQCSLTWRQSIKNTDVRGHNNISLSISTLTHAMKSLLEFYVPGQDNFFPRLKSSPGHFTSQSARNIGVIFDRTMTMLPHITSICKSASYHLRNISRIRKFLSTKTTEILVHAFVSSKLDHCNSLLYNVPKYILKKLQSVQNAAARLITCSRKYDHITSILKKLHWLPVSERIKFKILLLTFKALHQQSPNLHSRFVNMLPAV